jgi:hypothetical protein
MLQSFLSYGYVCHVAVTAENKLLLWSSREQVRTQNFSLGGGGNSEATYNLILRIML